MLSDNIDEIPEHFTGGMRGILLLHRNKDGALGNAQTKSIKRISKNPQEWKKIVYEFLHLKSTLYPHHRVYASLNPRNIDKAIREFKRRQLENDYASEEIKNWFYQDISNSFFSCLMNPNCRDGNYFLIDCDSEQEYQKARVLISSTLFVFEYKTKNGWHIITNPFNPNEIKLEIKKDDLIYIG